MESILNVGVSRFENYSTPSNPKHISLLNWLLSEEYCNEVEQIRKEPIKEQRDKLKEKLPAITPSCTCSYRNEKFVINHSGFIQFDIDFKENQHLGNFYELKEQLCNIKNVAYCGQSVSGAGFWGLIPIAYPEKHKQHFESLKLIFAHFGIVLDERPKNIISLRGYSFDSEPYFNHHALPLTRFEQPKPNKTARFVKSQGETPNHLKVEACINEIMSRSVDLTGSYNAWFEIGCSLANSFGESGREYFHQVSQFYPDYSSAKTDKQFTECLKGGYRFTLGTFYNYCHQEGIRYKALN